MDFAPNKLAKLFLKFASLGPQPNIAIAFASAALLGINHLVPSFFGGMSLQVLYILRFILVMTGAIGLILAIPSLWLLYTNKQKPVARAGYCKRQLTKRRLLRLTIAELTCILTPYCSNTRDLFLNPDDIVATHLTRKGIIKPFRSAMYSNLDPDFRITQTAWDQMHELDEFRVVDRQQLRTALNHLAAARRSVQMWRALLKTFPQTHPAVIHEFQRLGR